MGKQTETVKPTLKELLLSDSDRFDLEIPERGDLYSRQQKMTKQLNEICLKDKFMTFEDWMWTKEIVHATAQGYAGAIRGRISEWATDTGIINDELSFVVSNSVFESIDARIRELPNFQDENNKSHRFYSSALSKFKQYLLDRYENSIDVDTRIILNNDELTETEKKYLIKLRVGQGFFRNKLITHWGGCAVTGFKDTELLIASHIKPWSVSNNKERLDQFNGLLLLPNLDKAFDAGFITFDSSGRIEISRQLAEYEQLGITSEMKISLKKKHDKYLEYHRTKIFRSK